MRYKDTDFLHASARVTYLENQLITKDDLLKAADAENSSEAFRILSGKNLFRDHGIDDYEKAFEESLSETYSLIEEITGEMGITHIFRYPVDGHNLKVMIKDKAADGDYSGIYKSGGIVDISVMKTEMDSGEFDQMPGILGEAGVEARDALAKTGNPQTVDLMIDKAVISLMNEKAEAIDSDALSEYVKAKIDLMNIKSALRLLKMKKDTHNASKAFAEGGSFSVRELEEAYAFGFDGIKALTEKTAQSERIPEAVAQIKQGSSIGVFEQQADGCFRDLFEKARVIPFGIEPVIAFLYLKEQEIRACRLVLVSKLFDIPKDIITERLRCIYAD